MSRSALATTIWIGGATVAVIAGILLHRTFPLADSAMFEYGGRALLHGQVLYRDVWDNKLPGVYLVNALLQVLFDEHYILHTFVECLIAVVSGLLLARVIGDFDLPHAASAGLALVFLLCLVQPEINQTEWYALPLLLAAIALRRRPLLSGLCIGLATMFWIPSVLLLAPLAISARIWLIAVTAAATVLTAVAVTLVVVGSAALSSLPVSWVSYVGTVDGAPSRYPALRPLINLWWGSVDSGALPLALLLAVSYGRPHAIQQRFGLVWCAAMLIATLFGTTRFYPHYFMPLLPALLFTLCSYASAFSIAGMRQRAMIVVAVLAFVLTIRTVAVNVVQTNGQARATDAISAFLTAGGADGQTLSTPGSYQPGIFLATHARLPDPRAIVAAANQHFSRAGGGEKSGTVVVLESSERWSAPKEELLPASCTAALGSWRVAVVNDPSLAHRLCAGGA